MYICTLAEIKAQIGITDTVEDTVLTAWINGLETRFEGYCQRKFLREVGRVQYFSGADNSNRLYLDLFPLEDVIEVQVEDVPVTPMIKLRKDRGILHYGVTGNLFWPRGMDNIRVTWTGGYVAAGTVAGAGQTAMPEDLRRAMQYQVGYEWRQKETLGMEAKAELTAECMECLNPYRRIL